MIRIMKRSIALLLILVMMFCLVACTKDEPDTIPSTETKPTDPPHTHSYIQTVTAPDCTNDGYTTYVCECGDTYQADETAALGHTWADATCQAPKTCTVCAFTEGDVADHDYQSGTCSVCGEKDPNFKALTKGSWVRGKIVKDQYVKQTLTFSSKDGMSPAWDVRYFENIGTEADPDFMDYLISEGKLIQIDGIYYQHMGMGDMGEISFTEKGNTITVIFLYWESSIVLERISGNQLQVTAIKGNPPIDTKAMKVGDIFTWTK